MLENPTLKNITDPNFGRPPEHQNELLQRLGEHHITSFNYMIRKGLSQAIDNLNPVEFVLSERRIKLKISNYTFNSPEVPFGTIGVRNNLIYPTECRQRAATYKGKLYVDVDW
ncbi:hypothetical protein NQ318_002972 [Aromia moschata]|uniref:DNA-directed RNA polymerase n=1 Tax=Aromia moschata TaxID=1265417 RepID=A0AAV8YRJ3_9CUCU|nr:hypothetical protein NQ318_002972 [Aromia moschata]